LQYLETSFRNVAPISGSEGRRRRLQILCWRREWLNLWFPKHLMAFALESSLGITTL